MFHFDAHPDLSIPSTTKHINTLESWKDTEQLYGILSEEGGIAEFILPLVSTNLLSQVVWIRSEWCDQLPDGEMTFLIRDQLINEHNTKYADISISASDLVSEHSTLNRGMTAPKQTPSQRTQPNVSYRTAYYLDEGVVCCEFCNPNTLNTSQTSVAQLNKATNKRRKLAKTNSDSDHHHITDQNAYTVNLLTTTANCGNLYLNQMTQLYITNDTNTINSNNSTHTNSSDNSKLSWILDICLDYFTTTNPFLHDLEQTLLADIQAVYSSGDLAHIDAFHSVLQQFNDLSQTLETSQPYSNSHESHNAHTKHELHTSFHVTQQHALHILIEIIKNSYKYLAFRHDPTDEYTLELIRTLRQHQHSTPAAPTNHQQQRRQQERQHSVNNQCCECEHNKYLRSYTNCVVNTLITKYLHNNTCTTTGTASTADLEEYVVPALNDIADTHTAETTITVAKTENITATITSTASAVNIDTLTQQFLSLYTPTHTTHQNSHKHNVTHTYATSDGVGESSGRTHA